MRRACLNIVDSTIDLQWYRPVDNCNSFTHFNLYGREDAFSVFQFLGSYNNYALQSLTVKLPNLKDWEFYLMYHTTCNGIDSIISDTLGIDRSPPVRPVLDSVSVDLLTQKTVIGWGKNPSPDVKSFIVYLVTPSTNKPIGNTIPTYYKDDVEGDPTTGPVSYDVAATDSCNISSIISIPHKTIFLKHQYDFCAKNIVLDWTAYEGWNIDRYEIYGKVNSGNYQWVGTVVSNIQQFTFHFNSYGDNYCFFVRAFRSGSAVSSSSNTTCLITGGIIPSDNSYIAKASVQNKAIELSLITQTGTSLQRIHIYKGEDNGGFGLWQSINTNGGVLNLIDPAVYVHSHSYKYYFTTEGPCPNQIFDSSQVAKTILLHVVMQAPGDQLLSWSLYDDFIKSTAKQELLLSDDETYNKSSPWNFVSSFGNTSVSSADQTIFSVAQQKICYCLRAIENPPDNPYNRQDTSYSNIECVTADPIVYFPNAIQLNGFNVSFYPKGAFIDYTRSTFRIISRWGEIIYETDDIRKAWDGTFNGVKVESNVYAYRATIVGINGKILHFTGTLTVLD